MQGMIIGQNPMVFKEAAQAGDLSYASVIPWDCNVQSWEIYFPR